MSDPFAKERLSLALLHRDLDELLPEEEARSLEEELAQALQDGSSQALSRATQTVLQTPARDHFLELLRQNQDELLRGISTIPGDADPVDIQEYVCPKDHCHYHRYRFFAGDPIPQCPDHHIPLIPREEASC